MIPATYKNEANLVQEFRWIKNSRTFRQSIQGREIDEIPHQQRSPINFVEKIQSPVLLVHGRDDTIVLPESSIEFQRALKREGKDVEIKFYDEFAHLKAYSYPSHPIGKKYWEDCVDFLKRKLDLQEKKIKL